MNTWTLLMFFVIQGNVLAVEKLEFTGPRAEAHCKDAAMRVFKEVGNIGSAFCLHTKEYEP